MGIGRFGQNSLPLLEAIACLEPGASGFVSEFARLGTVLCSRLRAAAVMLARYDGSTRDTSVVAMYPECDALPAGTHLGYSELGEELAQGVSEMIVWNDAFSAWTPLLRHLAQARFRSAAAMRVYGDENEAFILGVAAESPITPSQAEMLRTVVEALRAIFSAPPGTTCELKRRGKALSSQEEQLLAVGHLARSAAHEINNAMAAVLGQGQLLLEELGADPRAGRVRAMVEGCTRLMTLARTLEENGAPRVIDPCDSVDLAEIAQEAVETLDCVWGREAAGRGRRFLVDVDCEESVPVRCAPSALRRAITHVLFNAVQAMGETGGVITVRVAKSGGEAICQVEDTGVGMTSEVLKKARYPFFTTRPQAGKGLGLTLTDAIIRQHGGDIEIQSTPDNGTTVTIYLPLATA